MQDSRDHILKSSLSLFLQKGFKDVTMNEIVGATGLSKGAFYHYFSSKEQVFEEVISLVFNEAMTADFRSLAAESLKQFYENILTSMEKKRFRPQKEPADKATEPFQDNHYYLIFDAMRLVPEFRKWLQEQRKHELKAWKTHVAKARKSDEIGSGMTDEQIAKLFIYLADGLHIKVILDDQLHPGKNELKQLWDGLYQTLKK